MHGHDADAVDTGFFVGIERIGRLDRSADDHGIEPLVLVQLVLPVDEGLQLLRAAGLEAVNRVFGHDGVKSDVDRVDTFTQDCSLAATLTKDRLVARGPPPRRPGSAWRLESCCMERFGPESGLAATPRRRGRKHSRSCLEVPRPRASCECGIATAKVRNASRRASTSA